MAFGKVIWMGFPNAPWPCWNLRFQCFLQIHCDFGFIWITRHFSNRIYNVAEINQLIKSPSDQVQAQPKQPQCLQIVLLETDHYLRVVRGFRLCTRPYVCRATLRPCYLLTAVPMSCGWPSFLLILGLWNFQSSDVGISLLSTILL